MSLKSGIHKYISVLGVAALLLTGNVAITSAASFTGLTKASVSGGLEPGLAVRYYGAKLNSIRQLIEMMDYQKGKQGPPIPMLNYHVGKGIVLTATATDMVGADITGYINFTKKGRYIFLVQSNDGIRLNIGGKQIYEDPDVHADRFSDELYVEITDPGWYPIHILYFEKKNTSTLELYWQEPGGEMDFVPAEAFGHK